MKISLNWLSDFIDIKEKDPQKIADILTERVAEVDKFFEEKNRFNKIVVGEILKVSNHPNADKLQLAKVKINENKINDIVCGANNIQAGQKVPVALIGAKIGDFVIERRKIRGEESNGMLCSKKELDLGDEHAGIFILPNNLKIGQNFAEAMGFDDTIFEIDNTAITNRPDLFSHFGFAREFVATGLAKWKKNKKQHIKYLEENIKKTAKNPLSSNLQIKEKDICPRWCGIEIENVIIGDSPNWLQKRLANCGIRPISNIVDVTNYVMLELGMPMHAFDRDKINGKKLVMRQSKKGEKMQTLDEKIHILPDEAIIIEDEKEIFDLCGLMGGASSAINNKTKNLLIHAPVYHPIKIRKAALCLNHRTDAAVIYEKGVPESVALAGLMLTVDLITKLCPKAKIATSVLDIWPNKKKTRNIKLQKSLIERMIGESLQEKQIEDIMQSLEFQLKKIEKGWNVSVPPHRFSDINITEDLAEEVSRIYGLNNIKASAPQIMLRENPKNKDGNLKKIISDFLVKNKFFEVLTFSFYGLKLLERAKMQSSQNIIEIQNPLSADQSLMRESILPRLLETAEKNRRFFDKFSLFEIGKIFQRNNSKEKKEYEHLTGIMIGNNFFSAKGIIESLFAFLNISCRFEKYLDKQATIFANNINIGKMGVLEDKIATEFGLAKINTFFDIDLEKIKEMHLAIKKYKKMPVYPAINFDISIIAPIDMPCADIIKLFEKADPLIVKSEIIEIFTGKDVPDNKKSVTLSFEFRSADRTLEEADAKKLEEKIVKILSAKDLRKRFQ